MSKQHGGVISVIISHGTIDMETIEKAILWAFLIFFIIGGAVGFYIAKSI